MNNNDCPNCNSQNIIKRGKRKTKTRIKQVYYCKNCNSKFTKDYIKYIKATPELICLAMDLYFKNMSFRGIADHFSQFHFKISHETIRRYIIRYIELTNKYIKTLKPELSDKWQSDEQIIKIRKYKNWVWNIIDEKTKYLIASGVTLMGTKDDGIEIYKEANKYGSPKQIKTDGAVVSSSIVKNLYNGKVKHVRSHGFKSKTHTNLIENYHTKFRAFDKTRRCFKSNDTAQVLNKGFVIYHNFIRRNLGDNKTPCDRTNLKIDLGKNKWLGLLSLSLRGR